MQGQIRVERTSCQENRTPSAVSVPEAAALVVCSDGVTGHGRLARLTSGGVRICPLFPNLIPVAYVPNRFLHPTAFLRQFPQKRTPILEAVPNHSVGGLYPRTKFCVRTVWRADADFMGKINSQSTQSRAQAPGFRREICRADMQDRHHLPLSIPPGTGWNRDTNKDAGRTREVSQRKQNQSCPR